MSQIDLLAEYVQETLQLVCSNCGAERIEYRDTKSEFAIYAEQEGWRVENDFVLCPDCSDE